jgi:Fe-S-cluster containining protein
MEFRCIQDCADCCIKREYYPDKKFGKIGVLILPEEKEKIEKLSKDNEINITILPRIGVSHNENEEPKVLAYQMMGVEKNGNTCPFLDTKTEKRSPHGGYPCKIYANRPLACKAYPLIQIEPIELDQKCKFCKEKGFANENLDSEIESLLKIKTKMSADEPIIWRYATGIGEKSDKNQIKRGWILNE